MLHTGKVQTIDRAWWMRRREEAFARRKGLFDKQTTAFRWINGESDGWPGLVLDRYGGALVLKLYTAAWLPRLEEIADVLVDEGGSVVLRLSRNIQDVAREKFGRTDGSMLRGPTVDGPVVFLESGLSFEADVMRGQKTGFFLDQRENRREVGLLARGRRVLNAFSFSGAFSLYAARGGARSATDLDLSKHALWSAERNFALNHNVSAVAACGHELVPADAFKWLEQESGRKFDMVILDPPSLARREVERAGAVRAYSRLCELGIRHLEKDGILVACSCSAHVSEQDFFSAVRAGVAGSGRKGREFRTTEHAPDHPATFPEAKYLKAAYWAF